MGFLQLYSDNEWLFHHSLDQQLPPNEYAMHGHDSCEILCVISGRGHFYVEDAVYPVGPGSVFIVRSWEQHRIEIEPNTPYERMVFWFKKEQIEKLDPQHVLLAPFFDRQPGRDNAYADGLWKEWSMIIRHQPSGASPAELCALPSDKPCACCARCIRLLFPKTITGRVGAAASRRCSRRCNISTITCLKKSVWKMLPSTPIWVHRSSPSCFGRQWGCRCMNISSANGWRRPDFKLNPGSKPHKLPSNVGFLPIRLFIKPIANDLGKLPRLIGIYKKY